MKILLLLTIMFIFSAQVNAQNPDWVWARSIQGGNAAVAEGIGVTTDNFDNAYISGWSHDTLVFGTDSLFTPGNSFAYIAKYSSAGNLLWHKINQNSASSSAQAFGICTDHFGYCYLTGSFYGTVSFGSLTLVSGAVIFLTKYDSLGNEVWAKQLGSTSSAIGYSVAIDNQANVYVTGKSAGGMLISKLDSSGNQLWSKTATASSIGWAIAVDSHGNAYITGSFNGPSVTIDSITLVGTGMLVAKFDSSGNILWAKNAASNWSSYGYGIALDVLGNPIVTGLYSKIIILPPDTLNCLTSDAFLVKYDTTGNIIWAKSTVSERAKAYSVAVDKNNKIYQLGGFDSTTVAFDSIILQRPAGAKDAMFIAAYDSSGLALFAKALASGGDDMAGVTASNSGCVYICSDIWQVSQFIVGNDTLILTGTASNSENVFLAKLCDSGFPENAVENIKHNEFLFYPNPCHDIFNIKGVDDAEISLFDLTSRLLLHQTVTNSTSINTENLANGIYFIEVKNANGAVWNGKIIKE